MPVQIYRESGIKIDKSIGPLIMEFNDVSGVPTTLTYWNTLFRLPTRGTPFSRIEVIGNVIELWGGKNITISPQGPPGTQDIFYGNSVMTNIIRFDDLAHCIIHASNVAFLAYTGKYMNLPGLKTMNNGAQFASCFNLEELYAPNLYSITNGFQTFSGCQNIKKIDFPKLEMFMAGGILNFSGCNSLEGLYFKNLHTFVCNLGDSTNLPLKNVYMPKCKNLGGSSSNDGVFSGISGRTFNLTVDSSLETNNGGGPDGDIQYAQANNTVNVTYINNDI